MPKAVLSNDKGLVQSSGNGLRLTPKNSNTSGLHFKTVEVDIEGLTLNGANNRLIAQTGIVLPANSIIVACTAVVTELATRTGGSCTMDIDVAHTSNTATSAGTNLSGDEVEILTDIIASSGGTLNKGFGTFLTTGKAVGAKTSVVLVNGGGSNFDGGALLSGKVVVTIGYSGTES